MDLYEITILQIQSFYLFGDQIKSNSALWIQLSEKCYELKLYKIMIKIISILFKLQFQTINVARLFKIIQFAIQLQQQQENMEFQEYNKDDDQTEGLTFEEILDQEKLNQLNEIKFEIFQIFIFLSKFHPFKVFIKSDDGIKKIKANFPKIKQQEQ
ncbi:unnamed protein product [Paramecium pentaurelia]|uniref:Uncharacterized protein n=1 Tax=Paramecium pentaurelia TaxID=43138 RepID=A0A8S1XVR9_9CILI|nr:unnamed protein product [Paramecium pentaurelia]